MLDNLSEIKRVEIELQSKCNRKCPWCPNTTFLRDESIEMPEELFLKIMYDLRDNKFEDKRHRSETNYVSFNRFCEPMYNIDLLKKRVNQAIKIMPRAHYLINTNGDYLSKKALDGLFLDKLNIMDYDCKGYDYWVNKLKGLDVVIAEVDEALGCIVGFHKNIGRVNCEVNWPLKARLEDRAGFLDKDIYYKDKKINWRNDKKRRMVGCIEPAWYMSIDYTGDVMLCCHFRSDNPNHKDFILGNAKDQTLLEIYNSPRARRFRMTLMDGNWHKYPKECRHCQKVRGVQLATNPHLDQETFVLLDHEK